MNIEEKMIQKNCYIGKTLCDLCYDPEKEKNATKNFENTNRYARKVRKYQNKHMKNCLILNNGELAICSDCLELIKETCL